MPGAAGVQQREHGIQQRELWREDLNHAFHEDAKPGTPARQFPAECARNADEAHERIVEALRGDDDFAGPSVDAVVPFEFSPDVVRRVAVWDRALPTHSCRLAAVALHT